MQTTQVSEGDRIELVSLTDQYDTTLTPGDKGTVTGTDTIPAAIAGGSEEIQIWIDWDCGSSLMLLDSQDDYKVLSSEENSC